MPSLRPTGVLFRVAAGPQVGFGHLARAMVLARGLRVVPRISLRGGRTARDAARRLGARLEDVTTPADLDPATRLVVIDDPSPREAARWTRGARLRGLPVASVHDLGLAPVASHLAIDGSLPQRRRQWPADHVLAGVQYAILDPVLARFRGRRTPTGRRPRIVVSLGGGRHAAAGLGIAAAVKERVPSARVQVGSGWTQRRLRLPEGVELLEPAALRAALGRATTAVVGGGMTLYEACAIGVPAVAVAVALPQRVTVRAFAARQIAIDGGFISTNEPAASGQARRVADAVAALEAHPRMRRTLGMRAARTIDGRGLSRVVRALTALAAREPAESSSQKGRGA